ncbi:hypothetical protein AB0C38_11580 [Amycolatopsis sp. NPDC048633]|uniref:hypothetical protein n=1 Tax=Amycolatopsis sp. NPDC048633 TaxID=3157095 RepID=UPI0033DF3F60
MALGRDTRLWPISSPCAIRAFFSSQGKRVITFAGYSELGYQRPEILREATDEVLDGYRPEAVLVHCGSLLRDCGLDGVAEVHSLAKRRGFETAGIHSTVAREFHATHRVSPYCDHVFLVKDETWGGFRPGTRMPTPTLQAHVDVSDEAVFIGGGKHTADEVRAFADSGKPVRYFPAEMNHTTTSNWCERAGVPVPDFRGAAYFTWLEMSRVG